MIERALIHVTGPVGAGKSTLIEQLLRSCGNRSLVVARCSRDDRLLAPRESRPRASTELRRYMQAGASNALLYRFPASHADGDAFYASHLMEDYSDSVLLEGDRPLEWVDLTVFVAPPLVEGSGLLRRVTRNGVAERGRAYDALEALLHEPDGVDRLFASHLGDLGGLLTPAIAKTREATRAELLAVIAKERRAPPPPATEHWALAEGYEGITAAQVLVVNVRDEDERRRGAAMVADAVRLRKDKVVFRDVLESRGSRVPITAVVANLSDRRDAGLRRVLTRVARAFASG